jgi:hypothetical protein
MHWHLERHDKALARLSNGQPQFGGKHIAADAFAEKFVANALDHVIDRGKVDRDFVGEALLGHTRRSHGVPRHGQRVMTEGARLHENTLHDRSRVSRLSRRDTDGSLRMNGGATSAATVPGFDRHEVMAGDRECPLCGTTMRLKESDDVVQIPGNPQLSSKRTREWVCPECDYFEEAEEEGA